MLSLDAGVASAEGGIVYAQQFMKETLEAYKELVKQAASFEDKDAELARMAAERAAATAAAAEAAENLNRFRQLKARHEAEVAALEEQLA